MKNNRKLSSALAMLIAFTGIGNYPVSAKEITNYDEVQSSDYQTNQTYIPEDFPNVFSEAAKPYYDLKIHSNFFEYALIIFNGRRMVSPVSFINQKKVYDPFPPYEIMATVKEGGGDLWFEINKGFFEKKDEVTISNVLSTENFFNYLDLDINDPKFSKLKESQNKQKNITIGEFIELFKQMVPREMLPIKLETPKVNINPTIPKFKEEFLSKPIDYKNFALTMIIDRKKQAPAFADFLIQRNDFKLHNFFSFTYAYEYGNYNEKPKYEKSVGYNQEKNDSFVIINDKSMILEFIGKYYPSLCEPFAECKTYGDLLEVYQMLPLEVQRQYKESDFIDNPYVDNSLSFNRPKKLEKLNS